jgi:heme-degrading monooxygenase HmoA
MGPGVLRICSGRTKLSDVAAYEEYSSAIAFDHITGIDGNRGLYLGHRQENGVAEFAAFSLWSYWSAVRAFADDESDRIADLPDDQRFLVDQWKSRENYKIFAATPYSGSPRVVRVWRDARPRAAGDDYEEHLRRTGFADYAATHGNLGAYMSRRDVGDTAQICCVTFWTSMDAVRAFAGDDPDRPVFHPEDDRFLLERKLTVMHYTVYAST